MTKHQLAIDIGNEIRSRIQNQASDFSSGYLTYCRGCTIVRFSDGKSFRITVEERTSSKKLYKTK